MFHFLWRFLGHFYICIQKSRVSAIMNIWLRSSGNQVNIWYRDCIASSFDNFNLFKKSCSLNLFSSRNSLLTLLSSQYTKNLLRFNISCEANNINTFMKVSSIFSWTPWFPYSLGMIYSNAVTFRCSSKTSILQWSFSKSLKNCVESIV